MKLMKNFNFVSSGFWVVSREGACCHHHDTTLKNKWKFLDYYYCFDHDYNYGYRVCMVCVCVVACLVVGWLWKT